VVAGCFSLALLFASYLSIKLPIEQIVEGLQAAFATRQLQDDDWVYDRPDLDVNQWGDCLILLWIVDRDSTTARLTVSPIWPVAVDEYAPTPGVCFELKDYLSGGSVVRSYRQRAYHNYIQADRTLMTFLLSVASLGTVRAMLKTGVYALLGMTLVFSGISLLRKIRDFGITGAAVRGRDNLFRVVIAGSMLLFYDLHQYASSIFQAPAELILAAVLCSSCFVDFRKLPDGTLFCMAACLGALTGSFDYFFGASPSGLSLLAILMAITYRESVEEDFSREIACLGTYVLAVILSFAFKFVMVIAVFGPEALSSPISEVMYRASSGGLSIVQVFSKIFASRSWMCYHNGRCGSALFLGAGAVIGCSAVLVLFMRDKEVARRQALWMMAAALVTPVWYAIFRQHTAELSWMMVRLMIWPITAGWLLIALWVVHWLQYRRPQRVVALDHQGCTS
jgi:hypothetical protein